ncbi:MAG: hypothetical protein E7602_07470 [Ruminococcaceae bacterium]|nr:hypothetical protein [Oscillospiraceae bacterium]
MKKRLIAIILCAFCVISACMLASCGDNVDTSTDTETETVDSSTDTDRETEVLDSSTDTESNIETNTESDTETDTESDTQVSDSSTDTESESEADETDTSTETETDTSTETETETETESEIETEEADSSTGTETNEEQNNSDISNLTVAEKRNRKVELYFQNHFQITYLEFCIEKNEDGNQYVVYAPNYYNYCIYVECIDTTADVWNKINILEADFLKKERVNIDAVILPDNVVMIVFPNFDSYNSCQEKLLNDLSELNSTERIIVDFFNAQNGTKIIENSYDYIELEGDYIFNKDTFIQSYEEFTTQFNDVLERNTELQKITEKTFEENYLFVIHHNRYGKVEISDAMLHGDTIYFTINRYEDGKLHDAILHMYECIVIVPKANIGELNQQIKIETVSVDIVI